MTISKKVANSFLKVAAVAAAFTPSVASAGCTATVQGGADCARGTLSNNPLTSTLSNIINVMIFVTGIIAVIFIIVGGLRYITSQGDEKGVQSSKNTILYAVVGLIVAILAYAIVNFVLAGISSGGAS
jgi:cytochrome bd-type quinol oxidase subunit 2